MKKLIIVLITIAMVFSLAACGGDQAGPGGTQNGAADSGIDLTSTEVQQMSEQRATREKLSETVDDWCEGLTMSTTISSRTYQDFADYIGCDATEYYYDEARSARVYTWLAEEEETAGKLGLWVKEDGGEWKAYMLGTTNL